MSATDADALSWVPDPAPGDSAFDQVVNHRRSYAEALVQVEAALWAQDVVDPALLELCRLRVATLVGSPAASLERRPEAAAAGFDEAKVAVLAAWPSDPSFSAAERAALAYAEQLVLDAQGVDDAQSAELVGLLGAPAVLVLTYACGLFETRQRAELVLAGGAP